MKKYIIIVAVLISGMIFAQSKEPKLEVIGQLVKATYFYENGKMQQEGFFNAKYVRAKWHAHLAGERNNQTFLWNVLMFQVWLTEQKRAI